MAETVNYDSRAVALAAAKAADSKKATDILVQDLRGLSSVTDYFVIVTAANNRQVDAIIDEIRKDIREASGLSPLSTEGMGQGTWALLDYGGVVVHVFQPEARSYYRLEELWNDAPVVDLKEAGITDAEYSDRIADLMNKAAEATEHAPEENEEA